MKTQNYKIVFNKYKVIFLRGSGGRNKKGEGTAAEATIPSGSWGIWGVKCGDRTHDLRNHNPTL